MNSQLKYNWLERVANRSFSRCVPRLISVSSTWSHTLDRLDGQTHSTWRSPTFCLHRVFCRSLNFTIVKKYFFQKYLLGKIVGNYFNNRYGFCWFSLRGGPLKRKKKVIRSQINKIFFLRELTYTELWILNGSLPLNPIWDAYLRTKKDSHQFSFFFNCFFFFFFFFFFFKREIFFFFF